MNPRLLLKGALSAALAFLFCVGANAAQNIWMCDEPTGDASIPTNWSLNRVPDDTDDILLNGSSTTNMVWDADGINLLPHTVNSWTQEATYTGTVTFKTTYNNTFPVFTVTDDVAINGGSWTHPENTVKDTEVFRLRVDVGGNFSLAFGTSVNLQQKGHAPGSRHNGAGGYGVHGGSRDNFSHVYGDYREPVNLGSGPELNTSYVRHAGGGALYLVVAGTATIDGTVNANTFPVAIHRNNEAGGAGGSVYIRAAAIEGAATGIISANGATSQDNLPSTGGRIALVTTVAEKVGLPLGNVYARGNNGRLGTAAGTVYVKTADLSMPNGTLIIDNTYTHAFNLYYFYPTTNGTTCIPPGQVWTNDAVVTRGHGILSIPPTSKLVLPNGFASVSSTTIYAPDNGRRNNGILYLGGVIDTCGHPDTLSGNWILHAAEPYTFNGNVKLENGGALGCLPLRNTLASHAKSEFIIKGNLVVDASSRVTAVQAGIDWDASHGASRSAHGGQPGYNSTNSSQNNWTGATNTSSLVYGSILNPVLPGMFGTTQMASGSARNPGSGVVILKVAGVFQLDGSVDVYSTDNYNLNNAYEVSGGAGGSANIIAGSLVGSGKIDASGYRVNTSLGTKTGTAPGRVAVRLANSDFNGFDVAKITAFGYSGNDARTMTSAGTIYLQTAEDGEGGGKIIISNGATANAAINNTISFTPFPSRNLGATIADNLAAFKNTRLDIGNRARVKLFDSVRMEELVTRPGTYLNLNGHTLTVYACFLGGERVNQSGRFPAEDLAAMGFATIDPAGGGFIEILSRGTRFILK